VTARALHADDVPVVDDLHVARRQHGGERLACTRVAGTGGRAADTDADPVGALAAACKAPLSAYLVTARHLDGGLQRIKTAREHLVRALRVDLLLRFDGKRGEIGIRRSESGDPRSRSIRNGDAFEYVQKARRRQCIAAETARRARAINARAFHLRDHVARNVREPVELVSAAFDLFDQHIERNGTRVLGIRLAVADDGRFVSVGRDCVQALHDEDVLGVNGADWTVMR